MNQIILWRWRDGKFNVNADGSRQYLLVSKMFGVNLLLFVACSRRILSWNSRKGSPYDAKNGWIWGSCFSAAARSVELDRGGKGDYPVSIATAKTNGGWNITAATVRIFSWGTTPFCQRPLVIVLSVLYSLLFQILCG